METTETVNMLYELAQTLAAGGDHPVAVALRRLVWAGYSNLAEVESASDWTLLSIPGIGARRLGAVRRLTRSDWQPPSPQAVKAVGRFLVATRFALRFWPREALAALLEGTRPEVPADQPHEGRWALDLFATAASQALHHCPAEDLLEVLAAESRGLGQTALPRAES